MDEAVKRAIKAFYKEEAMSMYNNHRKSDIGKKTTLRCKGKKNGKRKR